jgi:hypothetical protein
MRLSVADAGFYFWRRFAARLKAVPFPVKVCVNITSSVSWRVAQAF